MNPTAKAGGFRADFSVRTVVLASYSPGVCENVF